MHLHSLACIDRHGAPCVQIMSEDATDNGGSRPVKMSAFVDALMDYVIDPASWQTLTRELEHLDRNWKSSDAGEMLAQLSRAETLSWQLKNDGTDLVTGGRGGGGGFAFVLLDDQDHIINHSDNLLQLGEYLNVSKKRKLQFTHADSRTSYKAAKARLKATPRGHILVEIAHPKSHRHRYGYLVAAHEFPEALRLLGGGATRALLIANDQPDKNLRSVLQASFALTAAEADIMLKIASGMTLKEAAGELGISINTVRNHLQAIYDKSGINRQGDLVLVVTQLSIILAATGSMDRDVGADQMAASTTVPAQHFMILEDGRRLAYRTYGQPMDHPVLYLHETIGSSRLLPGTTELARELGLYLIAPERPGCGYSDPHAEFSFESVSADLRDLLDHLRVRECQVLGFLSGGGYALKLAELHPSRVSRLTLVAARPPAPMTGRFRFLMTLRDKMLKQPWLLSTFFNILRNRISEETNSKLIKSVYGSVEHDRQLLKARPDLLSHMVGYTMESMSVSAAGVINELQCFHSANGETPEKLRLPITVWHGAQDALTSYEDLQKFLGDKITRLRIFENSGSLILLEHWRELLEQIAGDADDL